MSMTSSYRRHNSMRHSQYDYTSAGAYFVTICVAHRACLFGDVVHGCLQLNSLGQVAQAALPALIEDHAGAGLDEYVIMPNHVHLLVWLRPNVGQEPQGTVPWRTFGHIPKGSLSTLVRAYKSSVTQQAKAQGLLASPKLWQRNFYDYIVRDEVALAQVRNYIQRNPERWVEDQLHPAAPPNSFNRG